MSGPLALRGGELDHGGRGVGDVVERAHVDPLPLAPVLLPPSRQQREQALIRVACQLRGEILIGRWLLHAEGFAQIRIVLADALAPHPEADEVCMPLQAAAVVDSERVGVEYIRPTLWGGGSLVQMARACSARFWATLCWRSPQCGGSSPQCGGGSGEPTPQCGGSTGSPRLNQALSHLKKAPITALRVLCGSPRTRDFPGG